MQDILIGSITLFAALIVSLLFYKKLEPAWFRLFPWFLFTTIIVQLAAHYYWLYTGKSNHFIFNIYILIEYGFYILICYLALKTPAFKKITALTGLLFALFYIYVVLISGNLFVYSTLARNAGALLSFLCCILFLSEILMADEEMDFFTIPMFWIVTGIMITNLGMFLYFSLFNYILKNNLDPDGTVYIVITDALTIIEFGLFTVGFLCKGIWKKTR